MSFDVFGLYLKEPKYLVKADNFPIEALNTVYKNEGFKEFVFDWDIRRAVMTYHTDSTNFPYQINIQALKNYSKYTLSTYNKVFILKIKFPAQYHDVDNSHKYHTYNNNWIDVPLILCKNTFYDSNSYVGSGVVTNAVYLNQTTGEITGYNYEPDGSYNVNFSNYNTIEPSRFKLLSNFENTFKNTIKRVYELPEAEYYANKIWKEIENFCNKITGTESGTSNIYYGFMYDLHSEMKEMYDNKFFTTIPVYNVNQYESCKNYLNNGTKQDKTAHN